MADEQEYCGPERRKPQEVRLTDATIDYIEERMTEAVKKAIAESINETNAKVFWAAGVEVLQKQASEHAGRFVLGGIGALAKRFMFFLMVGTAVYALGGWTALATFGKAIFSSGSH